MIEEAKTVKGANQGLGMLYAININLYKKSLLRA